MTVMKALDYMLTGTPVGISDSLREVWQDPRHPNLGDTFDIQSINADGTVRIVCDSTHEIYMNANLKDIINLNKHY